MSRASLDTRRRVVVELSEDVDALLGHVSAVLCVPKAQIAARALLDAMPGLLERADAFQRRSQELRAGVEDLGQARPVASQPVPKASDVLDGYVSDLVDVGGFNG